MIATSLPMPILVPSPRSQNKQPPLLAVENPALILLLKIIIPRTRNNDQDPATQYWAAEIQTIVSGAIDIWDRTSVEGSTIRKKLLREEIGAASSTQHNNEMAVKLGALAAMTGKSDERVSIYVKAANDFSTEYHESSSAKKDGDDSNGECSATDSDSDDPSDDDSDDGDSDDGDSDNDASDDDESDDDESAVDSDVSGPASTVEESDDEIKRQKCRRGKKKLLGFLRVAHMKLEQIEASRNDIGADQYQHIRKKTKAALLAHDRSLKQVEADARNDELIAKFDSDQELLAKAKKTGVHRPPRVLGYYPIRPMGFKVNLTLLHLELLDARGVSYDVSVFCNSYQKTRLTQGPQAQTIRVRS